MAIVFKVGDQNPIKMDYTKSLNMAFSAYQLYVETCLKNNIPAYSLHKFPKYALIAYEIPEDISTEWFINQ